MITGAWRGWLAALAIFLLGLATGAAGMMWFGLTPIQRALDPRWSARAGGERPTDRIGANLTKSLHLTPEESARVQAILDRSAGNFRAIRAQTARSVLVEFRSVTREIAASLPADKRVEFYRVIAQRTERFGLQPVPPESIP